MLDSKSEGTVAAEWFGGDTAESRAVQLLVEGTMLVVRADGVDVARWPLSTIRVDTLQEGGVAHVESTADPDRLAVTRDVLFADGLRARGARGVGLPRGRRAVVLGLSCAAGVIAIFGGLYAAAPWLSQRAAQRVPLSVERRLNTEMARFITGRTCDTAESAHAVATLQRRLDPGRTIPATVKVVNLPAANAFSLPGGDVLLTRGLVEEASGPDEVAGVLAHELAHVRHRHVLAELIERTFLGSLWAATIGDYSGVLVVDPSTVYRVATLRHSRDAEAEADATGAALLHDAGVTTAGLIAFFERNEPKDVGSGLSFLSTHPAGGSRAERLRAGIIAGSRPSLGDEEFHALQTACAGQKPLDSFSELFK